MLNRSASLAISTSVLKALLGKLDIKPHSPSIIYLLSTDNLCKQFGPRPGDLILIQRWSLKKFTNESVEANSMDAD